MAKFFQKPKYILPILALVVISSVFFASRLSNPKDNASSISQASNLQIFPTKVPPESTAEVHSADGKMKVVMKKISKIGSNLSTFTFTASDINAGNPKVVFTTTLPDSQNMEIPANSFSPDNKYLFLKENDRGKLSFFVFKATGETFTDGKEYIDVVPLFESKKYEFLLSDITGWDSNNLLHIFTVKGNDTRGPSFWFDVEGKSFSILGSI